MTFQIALSMTSTLFASRNGRTAMDVIRAIDDVEALAGRMDRRMGDDVAREMFRRHNLATAI